MDSLAPISLAELDEAAGLLTRVDRKYLVPPHVFEAMLARFATEFRVLDIEGRRRFDYHTVYFDTADFVFFREHAQGRRHRHKVRTRTYRHSGQRLLEVKVKGYRGRTEKHRRPHDADSEFDLTDTSFDLIDRWVEGRAAGRALHPVLVTDYRRSTLVHRTLPHRVTCDTDLSFIGGGRWGLGPDHVLVETKSDAGGGPIDAWLLAAGVREHSVSKYCVAAALLYPGLRANRWHRLLRRHFTAGPLDEADGPATRPM